MLQSGGNRWTTRLKSVLGHIAHVFLRWTRVFEKKRKGKGEKEKEREKRGEGIGNSS